MDNFELKAIKTQQMQRKYFPLNYLQEFVEEIYIHKGYCTLVFFSGCGFRVMLASQNEFRSVPSTSIFCWNRIVLILFYMIDRIQWI